MSVPPRNAVHQILVFSLVQQWASAQLKSVSEQHRDARAHDSQFERVSAGAGGSRLGELMASDNRDGLPDEYLALRDLVRRDATQFVSQLGVHLDDVGRKAHIDPFHGVNDLRSPSEENMREEPNMLRWNEAAFPFLWSLNHGCAKHAASLLQSVGRAGRAEFAGLTAPDIGPEKLLSLTRIADVRLSHHEFGEFPTPPPRVDRPTVVQVKPVKTRESQTVDLQRSLELLGSLVILYRSLNQLARAGLTSIPEGAMGRWLAENTAKSVSPAFRELARSAAQGQAQSPLPGRGYDYQVPGAKGFEELGDRACQSDNVAIDKLWDLSNRSAAIVTNLLPCFDVEGAENGVKARMGPFTFKGNAGVAEAVAIDLLGGHLLNNALAERGTPDQPLPNTDVGLPMALRSGPDSYQFVVTP